MQLIAHCVAKGAATKPKSFDFVYKNYNIEVVSLKNKEEYELIIKASCEMTEDQVMPFYKSDKVWRGDFEEILRPYKELLTEVAHLLEGIFAVKYRSIPPKFETNLISVTLMGSTTAEQKKIEEGEISGGLGHVHINGQMPEYEIGDIVVECFDLASYHLAALSFFTQAVRSLKEGDNEVAFFLFFRIIDGYFSDGATDVEKALQKKGKELSNYLNYSNEIIECTKSILSSMGLVSKSNRDYNGLISDIVLIRHKLTHFSFTNAVRHHSPKIKIELGVLNQFLYNATYRVLFERIHSQLRDEAQECDATKVK